MRRGRHAAGDAAVGDQVGELYGGWIAETSLIEHEQLDDLSLINAVIKNGSHDA